MQTQREMNEGLQSTLKSSETDDWMDAHVIRPLAYQFVRLFARLGIHPNAVSIISMVIGALSSLFFMHGSWFYEGRSGVICNVIAVAMLVFAGILDCVDGQLARLSGKCTRLGRLLDGVATIAWYIPIYLLIIYRIYRYHSIEFGWLGLEETTVNVIIATIVVFVVVHISGYICCMSQSRTADYYIQAHLFFLKGEKGSELDNSESLAEAFANTDWKGLYLDKLSQKSYINYTRLQESVTPHFQELMRMLREKYGSSDNIPAEFRERFHNYSLPIMRLNGLLTFNLRTAVLAICCIADVPFLYFIFESVALTILRHHIIRRHEHACEEMCKYLSGK